MRPAAPPSAASPAVQHAYPAPLAPKREASARPRPHLVGLDGLRAIAALAVLANHTGIHAIDGATGPLHRLTVYGSEGLTLFFAISGFLLYQPFIAAVLDAQGFPSVRQYFINRFLRIFPGYLAVFVLVAFVFGAANLYGPTEFHHDAIGRLTSASTILPNLFLVQSLVPSAMATGIGPAWSLTAELCFYLVLPLIGLLAWRLAARVGRVRALLIGPGLLIACGLVVTPIVRSRVSGLTQQQIDRVAFGHNWTAVLDRSLLSNADLFGYGMLAALAVEVLRRRGTVAVSGRTKVVLVGIAVVVSFAALQWNGLYVTNIFGACAALCIAVVVLPSPTGGVNRLARTLEWRPLRYVGLISFSVYLWHEPVIMWMKQHGLLVSRGPVNVALAADLLIVLAVAVALGSASYFFVEKPAMTLRKRVRARAARRVSAVNMR